MSLLSLVVTACGLALFGVSLFVSWKLCWIPWRERGLSPTTKEPQGHINPTMSPLPSQPTPREPVYTAVDPPMHNRRKSSHCSITKEPTPVASVVSVEAPGTPVSPPPVVMATPEAAMKISHTSPDIALDAQSKSRESGIHTNPRMQRQTTDPAPGGCSISEIGLVWTSLLVSHNWNMFWCNISIVSPIPRKLLTFHCPPITVVKHHMHCCFLLWKLQHFCEGTCSLWT